MSETIDDDSHGGPEKPSNPAEAFELWREPLCRFVRRTAASYGLADSHEGAEDLVQRVFEAALKTSWDSILSPRAWLYAVARRLVIAAAKLHAWNTRIGEVGTTDTVTWSSMIRLSSIEVQFAAHQVTELLKKLPTRQKQVAVLRLECGWRFAEIAEALEVTEANARVQYRNARLAVLGNVVDVSGDQYIGPRVVIVGTINANQGGCQYICSSPLGAAERPNRRRRAIGEYATNGELIAAALVASYPVKYVSGPNPLLGMSARDVNRFGRGAR